MSLTASALVSDGADVVVLDALATALRGTTLGAARWSPSPGEARPQYHTGTVQYLAFNQFRIDYFQEHKAEFAIKIKSS